MLNARVLLSAMVYINWLQLARVIFTVTVHINLSIWLQPARVILTMTVHINHTLIKNDTNYRGKRNNGSNERITWRRRVPGLR